jgi:hypothetical protein
MPKVSKIRARAKESIAKRYRPGSSEDDDANENQNNFNFDDLNVSIEEPSSQQHCSCCSKIVQETLKTPKEYQSIGSQTDEKGIDYRYSEIHENFSFQNIRDLICVLIDLIPNFGAIHYRVLSTIVYLMLRLFYFPWEKCKNTLKNLDLMGINQCHLWAKTIMDEDDICVILRDGRKGHKNNAFYEEYPDIESRAKAFAIEKASSKKASFCIQDLADFIDKTFREEYGQVLEEFGFDSNKKVRSVESCRVDLLKWGAKYEKNSNRPYFEGHEREDVVKKRKEFCEYFIHAKDRYFYPFYDENNNIKWNTPLRKKRILLSHDESTYRSGEVSAFRWFFAGLEPFFSKGRGRSIMVSKFIAQHPSVDIVTLSEKEWQNAVSQHPELEDSDPILNYYPRSANAWIEPKKDNYFDNKVILRQFERLFIILKYKEEFKDCEIEVLVDNARTHNAKKFDANLFNKKPGTNCPYETIEWLEDNQTKK